MPSLLFIHGASCDSRIWSMGFMQHFQQHHYVCDAIDLPGHGRAAAAGSVDTFGMDDYVAAIRRASHDLPAPLILVGHSMGGYVAQKFILAGGEAAALVLMASAPPQGMARELCNFVLRHPVLALRLDLSGGRGNRDARLRRVRGMLLTAHTPDAVVAAVADQLQPESPLAMRQLGMESLPNLPISIPLMVQAGAQDRLISLRAARTMARRYGTEVRVHPDMAHMLQVEPGWETVADEILQFLRQHFGSHHAAATG